MNPDCVYPNHPELQPGEVFVGNTTAVKLPAYLQELKTARLGEQAYDIFGHWIDPTEMRPVFVHSSESAKYNELMERRLARIRRRGVIA